MPGEEVICFFFCVFVLPLLLLLLLNVLKSSLCAKRWLGDLKFKKCVQISPPNKFLCLFILIYINGTLWGCGRPRTLFFKRSIDPLLMWKINVFNDCILYTLCSVITTSPFHPNTFSFCIVAFLIDILWHCFAIPIGEYHQLNVNRKQKVIIKKRDVSR